MPMRMSLLFCILSLYLPVPISVNDITVPYVTAAIETKDPFADFETSGIEV